MAAQKVEQEKKLGHPISVRFTDSEIIRIKKACYELDKPISRFLREQAFACIDKREAAELRKKK